MVFRREWSHGEPNVVKAIDRKYDQVSRAQISDWSTVCEAFKRSDSNIFQLRQIAFEAESEISNPTDSQPMNSWTLELSIPISKKEIFSQRRRRHFCC